MYDDTPVCPYCQHADQEWMDCEFVRDAMDGSQFHHDCPHCERTYTITVHIDYAFESDYELP